MSGGVLWFTNIIVFGLWFWMLDDGGPVERAITNRWERKPDFQFPQDETASSRARARTGTRGSRTTSTSR